MKRSAKAAIVVLLPASCPAGSQISFHTFQSLLSNSKPSWILKKVTHYFGYLLPVGKKTIRANIGGEKGHLRRIHNPSVSESSSTLLATFLIFSFHCGWCLSPVVLGEKLLCDDAANSENSNLLFDNSLEVTGSLQTWGTNTMPEFF